ncbi:MAG: 3-hydroxybutyrate oligomer hydrolase family protein, partial [Wenzhouxiangellaceae bacterium]
MLRSVKSDRLPGARIAVLAASIQLAACGVSAPEQVEDPVRMPGETLETPHRNGDDLLTAGLGLSGLRGPAPDTDPGSAGDLRRLSIHQDWRGLVDLTATGGFAADDRLPAVPGREFHAFAQLPGASQPFRVLLQLPDAFNPDKPCLVVAAASGSRGIYGALPVAGPWALPRGCALVLTDKGAGTDLFDHASGSGVALAGTLAERGHAVLGLAPEPAPAPLVSIPHAHSGDHPEADWGRHTIEAARFGLGMLQQAFPDRSMSADRVRVIATGISNGGGAVLRALELDDAGLFDAAVVAAPNITAPDARPLFDYATEAALLQTCLLADPEFLMQLPMANPMLLASAQQRCQSLHAAGMLDQPAPAAARAALLESGFTPEALEQAAVNTGLDLWRSVAAIYASAYLRRSVDAMPCGYQVASLDADGNPAPADADIRGLWWANSSGVVPGERLGWIDGLAGQNPEDPALPGLRCLRDLWTGQDESAVALRAAVEQTRATARLPDIPVVILHGLQDGLIPIDFSARPYVQAARANGADQVRLLEIDGAQHFDVLVPFPGFSNRYRPLLPPLWEALDRVEQVLEGRAEMPGDARIG